MRFPEIEQLHTSRLVLRKLTMEDVSAYYERIGSSEAVTKYMLFSAHKDISESVASIRKALHRYEEGRCYRWGIALKSDDSLIGVIELLRFDEAAESCSFAYMLGEAFWGQGYGTEALMAAFGFAFDQMQVQEIRADHMSENPASGAVMRKAGMIRQGTVPAKYEKNGIFCDAEEYRITRSKWSNS